MTNSIVLTGGGTAGHVTPNIAIVDILKFNNWDVNYIGSIDGVEKHMIESIGIKYYAVRCGKLRRYFSWQNFLDPFNLLIGVFQAYKLLKKLKTNIIFSKGGFVALPVVIAGYLRNIPVIIHESDMTPGLANKLSFPFATKICVNFSKTKLYIKNKDKVVITGTPIRAELFNGSSDKGLKFCGFNHDLPCLIVIGGGQGSESVNKVIRESLSELTKNYQVIHLCGPKKLDNSLKNIKNYCQFEYISKELPDLFAASSLVVSRSGANSLCEILALKKPHVLIPLSRKVSRGDQIENANYFASKDISVVVDEDSLHKDVLLKAIDKAIANSAKTIASMQSLNIASAGDAIFDLLKQHATQ
jgi:UDP-N-acetylglucosamine--N-acetylmuramyl-(pentapeptide) pyrophosphoryl-undecaprenol N-acetylglucosamine transferase